MKTICVCILGQNTGTLFHFVDHENNKENKTSMVALQILNIVCLTLVINDFTNLRMFLPYQSVLVEERKISIFVWWEMRNENKRNKDSPQRFYFVPRLPFHGKGRDELINSSDRDWRGSNPQLPPWQGGALTDWTTIPAICMAYIVLWFDKSILFVVL